MPYSRDLNRVNLRSIPKTRKVHKIRNKDVKKYLVDFDKQLREISIQIGNISKDVEYIAKKLTDFKPSFRYNARYKNGNSDYNRDYKNYRNMNTQAYWNSASNYYHQQYPQPWSKPVYT